MRTRKFDDDEPREITTIDDRLRALSARLAALKAGEGQLDRMHCLIRRSSNDSRIASRLSR